MVQIINPSTLPEEMGWKAGGQLGRGMRQSWERDTINQKLKGLNPDATIQEKWSAVADLNVSPEAKKPILENLKYLADQEAAQAKEQSQREFDINKLILSKQLDLQKQKEFEEYKENLQAPRKREEADYSKFTKERDYHTKRNEKAFEKADALREIIPRKQMALDFAVNAVKTGNTKYFSPNKLADILGVDYFRDASGAQLVTAAKENLLSNMGRVSAKAQNMWFEKRLSEIFPFIGQSDEANLTSAEMLETENMLDQLYIQAFDDIVKEEQEEFGYAKQDVQKRAYDRIKDQEKKVMDRAYYRLKELKEKEETYIDKKRKVGKKVEKGTPLTTTMAKLYTQKYGDKARERALKDGYTIYDTEDVISFRLSAPEYRKTL